jgi:serine/threonine protein kinase
MAAEFGRFEVYELLGYGGMGAVYRAKQESMGRMVALKVLLGAENAAPGLAARFEREARAMAKLSHANIVQVFGLGETTSGQPYFVMEYVEGGTLRDLVKAGPLEPERAMAIVGEVCDALQYAHSKGIVHRDIKPGNILLDQSGRVKVSDFGLAKILGHEETQMQLTRTQGAMGTHGYIAPEQMESGSTIDERADIYSVGVTLYEMLTGELPRGAFRPPSSLVAGLDRRVDDIVVRAMLAEPSERYQNISEIRSSLDFVREDESGELPLPEAGSGAGEATGGSGIPVGR